MLNRLFLALVLLVSFASVSGAQSRSEALYTNTQQSVSNKTFDSSNIYQGQWSVSKGLTGTISVSTCGSGSPTIAGADAAFVITLGTGTPTACTITFAATWVTSDITCVFISETDSVTWKFAKVGSANAWTAVTLTASAALTNASKIHGLCVGHV